MSNLTVPMVVGLLVLLVILPLLIWHFLIFENVNGMAQDLSWYNYDDMSGHYIYWAGFWLLIMGGGISLIKIKQ